MVDVALWGSAEWTVGVVCSDALSAADAGWGLNRDEVYRVLCVVGLGCCLFFVGSYGNAC